MEQTDEEWAEDNRRARNLRSGVSSRTLFVQESIGAGRPVDEVPWGGEFTDDDAPPPPYETNSEPFTWGPVATNDANVASMDVRRRHEQADYAELEQFGGSDEEKEY